MRYIERILQPGETLLYSGTIHWIIYLPGIVLWIAAVTGAYFGVNQPSRTIWLSLAAIVAVVAAGSAFQAWFKRWTTEIDVTDRRVVFKRGLIKRHTIEMNMDKVESVDVDQTIMGRLFNFGDVTINGTGEGWETLHNIGAPLDLRNKITAR